MGNTYKKTTKDQLRRHWLALIAALLVLATFLIWAAYAERQTLMEANRIHLAGNVRIAAGILSRQLEAADGRLSALLRDYPEWSRRRDGWREASSRMKGRIAMVPGVRTLLLLDADGKALASNHDAMIGRNFAHRLYFTRARQASDSAVRVLSPPFQGVLGDRVFTLSRRIDGPGGEFLGVVAATFDTDFFTESVKPLLFAPDVRFLFAHGEGAIISALPLDPAQKAIEAIAQYPESPLARHLAGGMAESLTTGLSPLTDGLRLAAFHNVRPASLNLDAVLVVGTSRTLDGIFAAWRHEIIMKALAFTLVAALASIGFALYQRQQRAASALSDLNQRYLDTAQTLLVALDKEGCITMGHLE